MRSEIHISSCQAPLNTKPCCRTLSANSASFTCESVNAMEMKKYCKPSLAELMRRCTATLLGPIILLNLVACAPTTITSQESLAAAVGVFAPSRYVVFAGKNDDEYIFEEKSKFGPWGPSAKFAVSRALITIRSTPQGQVFEYDQNNSRFTLGATPGPFESIPATFKARHTLEEEGYRRAMHEFQALDSRASQDTRIYALTLLVKAAYNARHHPEVIRYGQDLLDATGDTDTDFMNSQRQIAYQHLGLEHLMMGNPEAAARHLLDTCQKKSVWGDLFSRELASRLLEAGRRAEVLTFLEECSGFWTKEEADKLRATIHAQENPWPMAFPLDPEPPSVRSSNP